MTPTPDERRARAARRYERSQRFAGDRGGGWSPSISGSTPWSDRDERERVLDREIDMLRAALEDRGELKRGELGRVVACRSWGPGRFSAALRAAVARGAIARTGFGRYGPAR
jgi:hypothetical protein